MFLSRIFSRTLRETPSEAEIDSHKLLLRAGYIRQLAAGIFTIMPLGKRIINKIEQILREEINAIGGQEITMPVVHPAEIWKETGRWTLIDAEMSRFKDRSNRDMVLAMTHEEVVADLVRKEIRSYRQLPQLVYQIQTKWRDDPRPRAGLIRVREFLMKDSYSLDTDWEGLDTQYKAHFRAYFRIFARCELPVVAVASDAGMMGGSQAHEYMYLTPVGEDTIVVCNNCGYSANRQCATFAKPQAEPEPLREIEKVATPDCQTIEQLANFLGIPKSKTAKALFIMASVRDGDAIIEKFVFTVIRGDMDVNETKLANALNAKSIRPAKEDEIRAAEAEPGYGSPVGLKNVFILVDDSIANSPNLVAGANEPGFHLLNVNHGRDFKADIVCDVAIAREGDSCAKCQHPLTTTRGVEVGNIFKLGTRYSHAMNCIFLDRDGNEKPVIMGSYGIGIGRLIACIAEHHHDEFGLKWPITVAPYQVYIVSLIKSSEPLFEKAAQLYQNLKDHGIEVLFDDRDESPGVKFNDADLIGIPVRLTISQKSITKGGVELKIRGSKEITIIPMEEIAQRLSSEIKVMEDRISQKVSNASEHIY